MKLWVCAVVAFSTIVNTAAIIHNAGRRDWLAVATYAISGGMALGFALSVLKRRS